MGNNYSICKDEIPEKTVEKIKKLLKNIDLELTEIFFHDETCLNSPVSLRVYSEKFSIGTNGKGTSIINAKASGYAEFMERLQNSILINFLPEVNLLRETKPSDFSICNDYSPVLKKYFQKKGDILSFNKLLDIKECSFLDFYSLKDNKVYNFPYSIIRKIDGSNGMAAGNTLEEAIVQASSEICERYVLRRIISEKLSLPDILSNDYIHYTNIQNILEYYKESGMEVLIKDASLGGLLPCVCVVIVNRKKNFLHLAFGAHPSLPVAIERSLTEFAQGQNLKEYALDPSFYPIFSTQKLKYASSSQLILSMFHRILSFEINEELEEQFLSSKSDYLYSKNAFISEKDLQPNKVLLKFLFGKLFKITDDIFIRDNSFLGFPAVKIFIPNISEMFSLNEYSISSAINYCNWHDKEKNLNNKDICNINTLLNLAEYGLFLTEEQETSLKDIFCVTYEYIALLCAIVLKNYNKYFKFFDIILGQNKYENLYTEEQLNIFKIIEVYFRECNKNTNVSKSEIEKILRLNYSSEEIVDAFNIIENLTYESILNIVLKEKTEIDEKDTSEIRAKLAALYIKNEVNQNSLALVFK